MPVSRAKRGRNHNDPPRTVWNPFDECMCQKSVTSVEAYVAEHIHDIWAITHAKEKDKKAW